jgi:hypothetical protein
MSRRARRADHDAIERLRTRTASWEDRQDEALAGLLVLARSADLLAPPPPPVTAQVRRRQPILAGLATSAVAAGALLFSTLTTGAGTGTGPRTIPSTMPTVSSDAAAVSQLLDQVRSELTQAGTAGSAATRKALLAHAAATLSTAQSRARRLPPAEQAPLDQDSSQLRQELTRRGDPGQRRPGADAPPEGTGGPQPPTPRAGRQQPRPGTRDRGT